MLNTFLSLRLLLLVAIISTSLTATAQPGLTSEGREFWFGFMPNYITPAQAISIYVATGVPNKIKVEVYGEGGKIASTQSITLLAGQAYKFRMSVGLSETRDREQPVYRAVRVTSSSPSTVVGYSDNPLSTDAFLAIPVNALGKEHYCVSYLDDAYTAGVDHLGGEFLIVAPYDDTKVTITTTAATTTTDDGKTIGHLIGQTWTVDLAKGQTYLVQSAGWNYGVDDLTGSKITSNKPIGFLSGHQRAEIELEDGNSKEHLVEMLPSTDHWGTEYAALPHMYKTKAGNYYRVISAEDDNRIEYNGVLHTLNAGEFTEIPQVTVPIHFVSTNNKRFLAVQYGYDEGHFGDPGPGDPTMIVLTPVSNFVKSANFRTPSNAGFAFKHIAALISTKEGLNEMRLDMGHGPLPLSAYGAGSQMLIPGSPYYGVNILLVGDEVAWTATSSAPFTFTQYGFTALEMYGYPGPRSFAIASDTIPPSYEVLNSDGCGTIQLKLTDNAGIQDLTLSSQSDIALYNTTSYSSNFGMVVPPNFMPGDTSVVLTFYVLDGTKPATLAFYFVDKGGNDSIYTSTYTVRKIEWALDQPFPAITRVGDTVCRTVTYWNRSSDSIYLYPCIPGTDPAFHTAQIDDLKLGPNDSTTIEVCFIPRDTLRYFDSIKVITDCYNDGFVVTARAVTDKIHASDRYFGVVQADQQVCKEVEITNLGELPVIVTGYERSGDTSFTVTSPAFPFAIQPGAKQSVTICFQTTRDSGSFESRFDWVFEPAASLDKTYSLLTATVLTAGVEGHRTEQIQVWPNPASTWLSISDLSARSVTAMDMLGVSHLLPITHEADVVQASVRSLSPGVYTIVIEGDTGQYTRQLVIKR